jgi:outer membrane protein TolC
MFTGLSNWFLKLMIKFLIIVIVTVIVNSVEAGEDYLESLIRIALERNPKLQALYSEWQAREANILSETIPPQPQLRFSYFGESIQTKVGPQDRKYGITQKLPFPTKLYLKGKLAQKDAQIAYIKYLLEKRQLIKELKKSFYDYYFILESLKVLREEKLILETMANTIQRKYETYKVPQQDLVKAHLEINQIEKKILNLEKQRNFLKANINKIINRPTETALEIPKDFSLDIKVFLHSKEELLNQAFSNSPLILIDEVGIEKQKYKLKLTYQEYLPDFSFMGNGTTNLSNDGEDAWVVGIKITLPLWFWKINSDIRSEKEQLNSIMENYKDKENFLNYKIDDLYFKLSNDYQLIDLYKNVILPQAEQNFSTSRISYEEGVVDFLNWLDAERNLINIKIATIKQMVSYKKTIAELEYIVGRDLEK